MQNYDNEMEVGNDLFDCYHDNKITGWQQI